MSDRDPTHAARRTSTLRQLKVLVLALVLSNIALGGFGFYFLRAIDRKYSELIGRAVPTLNDMQTLTARSMEAMRGINPTLFTGSEQDHTEMAQRARIAVESDRSLRNTILKRSWLSKDAKERIDFQESGDHFTDNVAGLIPLLESGKTAEANQQREQIVRPSFDRYIAATTKATDLLQVESLRTSDTLSAQTGSISDIILGVAGWPVFLLTAIVLAAVVMILVVRIFLFNDQESAT